MFPIEVAGVKYYVSFEALKEFVDRGIATPVELYMYRKAKDLFVPTGQYVYPNV